MYLDVQTPNILRHLDTSLNVHIPAGLISGYPDTHLDTHPDILMCLYISGCPHTHQDTSPDVQTLIQILLEFADTHIDCHQMSGDTAKCSWKECCTSRHYLDNHQMAHTHPN